MKNSTISTDELNQLPKEMLVILYTNLNESFRILSEQNGMIQKQNEQLIHQVEDLKEQLAVLTQHHFGPRSERNLQTEGQLSIDLETMCILNEAKCLVEEGLPEEAAMEEVFVKRKPRAKGKLAFNLKDIETVIVIHECSQEELAVQFPRGFHALTDEVYKELKYVPGRFEVHEHHIRVYAGDHDTGGILRAQRPARLLDHSILTPELAAAIFNAKYVNAVPLKRLSEEFLRNDVSIPRQDMAGWMIRIHEYYLGPVHDRMKKELLKSRHLHCDESPFTMPEHGKEYMWVCHSPGGGGGVPVYLYEYPGTRGTDALRELLEGYQGTLVTDGYQVYHTMADEHPDGLKAAGCWAHARRRYAEIVKAADKNGPATPAQKAAAEAVSQIAAIYHVDNMYKDASASERLKTGKGP